LELSNKKILEEKDAVQKDLDKRMEVSNRW